MFEIGMLTFMVLGAGAMVAAGTVVTTKDKDLDGIAERFRTDGRLVRAVSREAKALERIEEYHERSTRAWNANQLRVMQTFPPHPLGDELHKARLHLRAVRRQVWEKAAADFEAGPLVAKKQAVKDAFASLADRLAALDAAERRIASVAPRGSGFRRSANTQDVLGLFAQWRLAAFPVHRKPAKRVGPEDILKELAS